MCPPGPTIRYCLEQHFNVGLPASGRPHCHVGAVYRHAGIPAPARPSFCNLLADLLRWGLVFTREQYDASLPTITSNVARRFLESDAGYDFTQRAAQLILRIEDGRLSVEELDTLPSYQRDLFTDVLRRIREMGGPPRLASRVGVAPFPVPRLALDRDARQLVLQFDPKGVAAGAYKMGTEPVLYPTVRSPGAEPPGGNFVKPGLRPSGLRVLLDTNILIHREASTVVRGDIGNVFNWLDRLKHEKCAHPVSLAEIEKHKDEKVRNSFRAKLQAYNVLKTIAPMSALAAQFAARDETENDRNDTIIVNEVLANRVDILITEDRGVHTKAGILGIADRVFTLDAFLEKVTAENPTLVDYKVLAVKRIVFGATDVTQEFFESFRQDYGGAVFDKWFARKADEPAYVCHQGKDLVAFLYLKVEGSEENYSDITPRFVPKRRLKIGTFKVEMNGFKLGERFLKIIFDNALRQQVDEVYVTIFPHTVGQQRLVRLLQDFGFNEHGTKTGSYGTELVLVRDMRPAFDAAAPSLTFPYVSTGTRALIVPIRQEYHTNLLPDSILRTESPASFVEQFPHRNAIRKVYISRSLNRDLRRGDAVVFYRTGGYYQSVVSTVGIIENVHLKIRDEQHFISLCRKRSVFSDKELAEWWNYKPSYRPFIVEFLYAYSFTKRPNMKELIDHGVIRNVESAPRGFEPITKEQFRTILHLAQADARAFVD